VAGALKHPAGPGAKGEHMPWLHQIIRDGSGFGHDADGLGAVSGADACGHPRGGIHAHLEVRSESFAVLADHALDAELLKAFGGRRHAD